MQVLINGLWGRCRDTDTVDGYLKLLNRTLLHTTDQQHQGEPPGEFHNASFARVARSGGIGKQWFAVNGALLLVGW
jgi:hypothetical protein